MNVNNEYEDDYCEAPDSNVFYYEEDEYEFSSLSVKKKKSLSLEDWIKEKKLTNQLTDEI